MVERAAELARDSHARTRHAAVLVAEGSLLAWGTNGVPFPGEDHCYCKVAEHGNMTAAAHMLSSGRSRWRAKATAGGSCPDRS
jgi:deoxycytidylate deaminase